jgi:hypothetical protein
MSFQFQRSEESWVVSIRKKDFAPAVGRSNAPSEIPIGTINEKTGALDPWPVAYGAPMLSTQSRNKPNREWWEQMALLKLKEAAGSAAFEQARRKYRKEEASTGDFIIKLSDGRENAFHSSKRGHDWAEEELKKMPRGSRAEFFRRFPKSLPPRTGSPWTEPFSAMEKNEHGVIGMANLRASDKKSGDFQSSRPWIVYRHTPKGLRFLNRFGNEPRANDFARDTFGTARHIDNLTDEQRRQLGLRG